MLFLPCSIQIIIIIFYIANIVCNETDWWFHYQKVSNVEIDLMRFNQHAIPSHIAFPGPVFCLLLGVNSEYGQPITGQVTSVTCSVIDWAYSDFTLGVNYEYAQPITGQVTSVTCSVIDWAYSEFTPSKRQKTGPDPIFPISKRGLFSAPSPRQWRPQTVTQS